MRPGKSLLFSRWSMKRENFDEELIFERHMECVPSADEVGEFSRCIGLK